MRTKKDLATDAKQEFARWEELIRQTDISEAGISIRPSTFSLKDTLVHLKTWQEITLSRLQAALRDDDPVWRGWPQDLNPDSEEDLDTINAWILEKGKLKSFSEAHRDWVRSFRQMLSLLDAIPEADLYVSGRYTWLPDYPLATVVEGSLDHHREHREALII